MTRGTNKIVSVAREAWTHGRSSYASTTPILNTVNLLCCTEDDEQKIIGTSGFKETKTANKW